MCDERPWSTLISTSDAGFEGTIRKATCQGGYRCNNMLCPYYIANRMHNSTSFRFNVAHGGSCLPLPVVCAPCNGVDITKIPCSATKKIRWESQSAGTSVRIIEIIHTGVHTPSCFRSNPRRRALDIPEDMRGNLERLGAAGAPLGPATQRNLVDMTQKYLDGELSQEDVLVAGMYNSYINCLLSSYLQRTR